MLTNFVTIKKRLGLLDQLEARQANGEFDRLPKKEASRLTEEMARLQRTLGGMRKMRRLPGALFVIDPHREHIAVTEARKLEIPVIGTGDTNVDPDELDYIIPANDDAIRAIRLLCRLVADAAIEGAGERASRSRGRSRSTPAPPSEAEEASDEMVAALAAGADVQLRARARRGRPAARRRRSSGRCRPVGCRRRRRSRGRAGVTRPTITITNRRPPVRSDRRARTEAKGTMTLTRANPSRDRQGAPRAHRRRLHGLQARPRGDRRRPGQGRRAAARDAGWRRPPRRPAATRARASSPATSTPAAAWACSSRSTARPTSWPATRTSRSSSGTSPCRSRASARSTRRSSRSRPRSSEAKRAELLADETTPEEAGEHPRRRSSRASCEVVPAGRALRAALPRHRPDGRPADHRRHRQDRREHPGPPLHPLRSSGRSCERGRRRASTASAGDASDGSLRPDPAQGLRRGAARRRARTASTRQVCAFIARQVAPGPRAGRRGRHRRRRRQHLPGPRRGGQRAWSARPATTWACSRRS